MMMGIQLRLRVLVEGFLTWSIACTSPKWVGKVLPMMERRLYLRLGLCLRLSLSFLFCWRINHQTGRQCVMFHSFFFIFLKFLLLMGMCFLCRTVRGGSPKENDPKRSRRPPQSKSYTVKISYATKIPIQAIFNALRGQESEQFHEAVRVLDVLLRQHAAKQ